jgi:hypothetical protein
MLKKPITFEDFDGNERTEIHYFNLNKGELAKMELTLGDGGGFVESLKRIAREKNPKLIIATFEDFISRSYGVRSEDGQHFYKNERILEQFKATPAFDALLLEMCTDSAAASLFINGVVPVSLQQSESAVLEQIQKSPEELLAQLDKSPAELARERSEAALRGHQPKAAPEPQRVADPVVQPPAVPQQPQFQPPVHAEPDGQGGYRTLAVSPHPEITREQLVSLPQPQYEQLTKADSLADFQQTRRDLREQGFLD